MECLKACSGRMLEVGCHHNLPWRLDRMRGEPRSLAFSWNVSASSPRNGKFTIARYPINRLLWRRSTWRAIVVAVSLEEEPSPSSGGHLGDTTENDPSGVVLPPKLGPDALNVLLADSERAKLIRKLSEANQYNRFLKRQLQKNDDAMVNIIDELASLEIELQALVALAEEVASSGVLPGTRKINGKYIHSHLLSRLQAVREKVKAQRKDAHFVNIVEISLFWVGMAESVQVMGSFDGWSRGEEMSPEYTGDYSRFSATLKLRPGRYEIKFLVDGEWKLSPEFPTLGEGLLKNNLLVIE